jgi:hypothetical protein
MDEIAPLISPAKDVTTEARASLSERFGIAPLIDPGRAARRRANTQESVAGPGHQIRVEARRKPKLSETNDAYMYNKKKFSRAGIRPKGLPSGGFGGGEAHAARRP